MSGAMDSMSGTRAEKFESIDIALKYGQRIQENRHRQQEDLFGSAANGHHAMTPELIKTDTWADTVSLQKKKMYWVSI